MMDGQAQTVDCSHLSSFVSNPGEGWEQSDATSIGLIAMLWHPVIPPRKSHHAPTAGQSVRAKENSRIPLLLLLLLLFRTVTRTIDRKKRTPDLFQTTNQKGVNGLGASGRSWGAN